MKLLPRRRRSDGASPAESRNDEEFDGTLDELIAEIDSLSATTRAVGDLDAQRRLLVLRHLAGVRIMDECSGDAAFAAPDASELPDYDNASELPGVSPRDLTPGLVRAAILRDGCLLVRGLVPRADAEGLGSGIEQAFAARERSLQGRRAAPGLYEEFRPGGRYGEVMGREWIQQGGGLLAADSPRLDFELMEIFRRAGLRELVSAYLGEPALVSVHKTTLRRADPSVSGAWHQDGSFMGETRSLNLWLALSRCGDVAPGLDILPRRLERYLTTATDGELLGYTISPIKVKEAAGPTPILRPIFEPGDALLFDERFVHQTASDPTMPHARLAVENWFFGGTGFPAEYAPLAV
jgi:hypothetical protein